MLLSNSAFKPRPSKPRRGLATLSLLITVGVVLASCALAIDVAFVAYKQFQMEVAAEAASRAGASGLLNAKPFLFAMQDDPGRHAALVFHAQRRAVECAAVNTVAGRSVPLRTNVKNDSRGDVVVGWMADPSHLHSKMVAWSGAGPVNSVEVRIARTRAGGNPLSLWFARALGLVGADRVITARATIDQRVYGFRPVGDHRLPIIPVLQIAGVSDDQRQDGGSDSFQRKAFIGWPDNPTLNDDYAVDRDRVRRVGDGIGEWSLCVPRIDDQPRADAGLRMAVWSSAATEFRSCCRKVRDGISGKDLSDVDGQLSIGTWLCASQVQAAVERKDLLRLSKAFEEVIGQVRAWPIVSPKSCGSSPKKGYEVIGFGAGCIVDCFADDQGRLTICVQPMPLQSCTALVGPGVARHPWIGKLVSTK